MKTQIYLVDKNGYFIESVMTENPKAEDITTPILTGYVKTKWNGNDWVEGATDEEISVYEAEQLALHSAPTLEQQIEELKIKVAELQSVLEV